MCHPAKIDPLIGVAVIVGLVVPLWIAIASSSLVVYTVFAFTCVVVFGFCYPQSYETGETSLLVHAGLRTIRVPYDRITVVRPTADARSGLAMSLDRVLVEYDSGGLLIAPKNQDAFLEDLLKRAPQLSRRGQDLVIALV